MATSSDWAIAYARQGQEDFKTFEMIQSIAVAECHKLQFLQIACEKLAKAQLCGTGTDPTVLQKSHAQVAKTLPVVLRQHAEFVNIASSKAREILRHARHLAREIELLAPAVKRGGQRPDNCEYPWTDSRDTIHLPLDWSFYPSQLVALPSGRTILKLIKGAIDRILSSKEATS